MINHGPMAQSGTEEQENEDENALPAWANKDKMMLGGRQGQQQSSNEGQHSSNDNENKANHAAELMEAERQRKAKAAEKAAKRKARAEERRRKAVQAKAGEMERRQAQDRESERMLGESERQKAAKHERLIHDLFAATREGRNEDVKALMESPQHQSTINQKDALWMRDGRGATLLHACVTVWSSSREGGPDISPNVKEGRLAVASYLLDLDAQKEFSMFDMIKDQDDQGRAVIHA